MRYFLILLVVFIVEQKTYSQITDTSYINNFRKEYGIYPNTKTPINNSLPLKCKVVRVQEVDTAYIIDVYKGNNTIGYSIISLKSEKQNSKKIKCGKQYKFVLFSYYNFIIIGNDPSYRRYIIDGILVEFESDFQTGRIVTTPNLRGLYYIGGSVPNAAK